MGSGRGKRAVGVGLLVLLLGAAAPQPDYAGIVFPSDNPWNWDISGFDVHPDSETYIGKIGADAPIREDYSFYYSVVDDSVADVDVPFNLYEDESDPGPGFGSPVGGSTGIYGNKDRYPIPSTAQIEGGSDAHVLVVKNGATLKLLYETYKTTR